MKIGQVRSIATKKWGRVEFSPLRWKFVLMWCLTYDSCIPENHGVYCLFAHLCYQKPLILCPLYQRLTQHWDTRFLQWGPRGWSSIRWGPIEVKSEGVQSIAINGCQMLHKKNFLRKQRKLHLSLLLKLRGDSCI